MKNTRIAVWSLFLFILFNFGCTYNPTETNYKEITIPENNINVRVLNPNSITELRGKVTFYIDTDLDGCKFNSIVGFLDSTEVLIYLNNSNQIEFNTEYYPDGHYTFTIYLFTSTGSGSLADRIGQEVFYARREYAVTLFNASIRTSNITDYSIVDGALSINWEKFDQYCFRKYELKKNDNVIATIDDVNQTSFIDTAYIGEHVRYELTTYVLDKKLTGSSPWYSPPAPSFASITPTSDEKLLLKWNEFPFTKAFGKYVIYGLNEETEIQSIKDTTIIENYPRLGRGSYYNLKVFSKTGVESQHSGSIIGPPVGIPFELNEPDGFQYIPEKNIFIRFNRNYDGIPQINYYDGDNLNLIQSSSLFYYDLRAISSNGEYMYVVENSIVYKINSDNLTVEDSTEIIQLIPSNEYTNPRPIQEIAVSDNNFLIVVGRKSFYNARSTIEIFDMSHKKWVTSYELGFGTTLSTLQITNNGQFIKFYNQFFEFNGDNINKIGEFYYGLVTFSKDSKSIIGKNDERITIYDCATLQIQKEFPAGDENGKLSIDPKTGYLGAGGRIYDLSSGAELGYIRLNSHGVYLNGYYFCEGYYKYVELF